MVNFLEGVKKISFCFFIAACGGGGGGGGGSSSSSSPSTINAINIINSEAAWVDPNNSVTTAEANVYRTAEYNLQWGLEDIHAAQAYALLNKNSKALAGLGAKIVIADSGVDTGHLGIKNNLDLANSYNFTARSANVSDAADNANVSERSGHSTHVASIAAGVKDDSGVHGVAYNSQIVIADIYVGPTTVSLDYMANVVNLAHSSGAVAINASFGGNVPDSFFQDALTLAKQDDILFVAAAGNTSTANDPVFPARMASGYSFDGYVLAVGSVDYLNESSTFSNSPYASTNRCGAAKDYCLFAPGGGTFSNESNLTKYIVGAFPKDINDYHATIDPQNYSSSANPYYGMAGTSMATPHVTGAIAVLRAAWPTLTAPQTAQILLRTATDLGAPGVDDIYGHGLLNLYEAVQAYGTNTLAAGTASFSPGYTVQSSSLTTNPIFGDAFAKNVTSQIEGAVFFDDFGRDYKANLASKISAPSALASMVNNLNAIIANNYKTNIIPLSFNSKMFFGNAKSFSSSKIISSDEVTTSIKFQTKSYSDSRSKHLVLDNSNEDKSLTTGNGFAISQEISKETAVNFSFNIDEIRNSNFTKANNFNFLSASSLGSNPFQSFMTSSSAVQGGSSGNSIVNNGNVNNAIQKNFNQMMLSQKFFDNKFKLNLSNQTSYNNSSVVAKSTNKENQISDLSFAYNPNDNTNVALSFGKLNEFNNNFLNSKALGAFGNANNVNTSYVKIAAMQKVFNSDFSIIASFSEGQTKASGDQSGIFRSYSDIRSRSSSIGLINENFFNGKFGIAYNEPMRVYKGSVNIDVPTGQDANGNVIRYNANVSLRPQGRERNLELFYATTIDKKSNAHISLNFLTTKDAGSVKRQGNAYLGVVSFGIWF